MIEVCAVHCVLFALDLYALITNCFENHNIKSVLACFIVPHAVGGGLVYKSLHYKRPEFRLQSE